MHEVQVTFPENVEDKGKYLLTTEQLFHRAHWRAGGTSGEGTLEQWGSDAGTRRTECCGDDALAHSQALMCIRAMGRACSNTDC